MKKIAVIVVVIMLAGLASIAASRQNAEENAVRQTVQHYLYGLKHNDVGSLKKAFYPEAKLLWIKKDNQLGQLTQEQWHKGFEANAGKEEAGDLRIAAVDITGDAASVKVVEVYDDSIYTDYLSLLKLGGEWKIVNKIYTVSARKK
jgi:hypothetical protein